MSCAVGVARLSYTECDDSNMRAITNISEWSTKVHGPVSVLLDRWTFERDGTGIFIVCLDFAMSTRLADWNRVRACGWPMSIPVLV